MTLLKKKKNNHWKPIVVMANWDYDSISVEWYFSNLTFQKKFWRLLLDHNVWKTYCITSSCCNIVKYYIHNFGVEPMILLKRLEKMHSYMPWNRSFSLVKYIIDNVPLWCSYVPQISFKKVVYFFFIFCCYFT